MDVRIFLVEDLPGMRSLLEGLFASLGGMRMVGSVATEAEAKLWLDHNAGEWDVALVDLVLDQGSGLGLIRHCKTTTPSGQVAVFSSYATPGIVKHCLALGADAVFDKSDTQGFIEWLHAQSASRPAP